MNDQPIVELLLSAGFPNGWALAGDKLILWEYEIDPPAPLTRPESKENDAE